MWAYHSIFYQIYPIGFCDAPTSNDGITVPRILKKLGVWIDYFESLGVNAVLLNPVFESDHHGYDTRDFLKIDCRLGTNEDFSEMSVKHFTHMESESFWMAFLTTWDEASGHFRTYWKRNGNLRTKTGFISILTVTAAIMMVSGTRGGKRHFELVKLNLQNPAVTDYFY